MKADVNNRALKVMTKKAQKDIQEEIMRNKLKMAAPDEIMINIIPEEKEYVQEENHGKSNKFAIKMY